MYRIISGNAKFVCILYVLCCLVIEGEGRAAVPMPRLSVSERTCTGLHNKHRSNLPALY